MLTESNQRVLLWGAAYGESDTGKISRRITGIQCRPDHSDSRRYISQRRRTLEWMRWGLILAWAENEQNPYSTFNARADTIATKPAFRGAWKAGRHCLVVTGRFYEWRKIDKQPFCVSLGNKQPMLMAGLWEEWKPRGSATVRSCAIITTNANALLATIHDRMPVILGSEDWAEWLDEERLPNPAAP